MSERTPVRGGTAGSALADIGFVLREAWHLHPRACALSFVETLSRVLRMLEPLFVGLVVGGLIGHRLPLAIAGFVFLLLAMGAGMLLATIGVHERLRLYELVGHEFDQRTGRLIARVPTLEHLEDPHYLDEFQAFRDRPGVIGMAFNSLVNVANNLLAPLVLVASAALADWRMLVLAALGALTVVTARFEMRWDKTAEEAAAAPSRRAEALVRLALEPTSSAELRVFGARAWLLGRLRGAVRDWRRPLTRAATKTAGLGLAVDVAYYGAAGAVLAWVVADAAAGRVAPANLTVCLAAVANLASAAGGVSWGVSTLSQLLRNLRRYRLLESYEAGSRWPGTQPPPPRLREGIRLRGVDFTYPGATEPSLHGLDLELPAGAVVAVVGENGAGKSTLVKLLTGLYVPDDGRVEVDGVSLDDLDIDAWRARCAGAFQDHLPLQTTALEAITVGDLAALGDEGRAREALEAAAGTDVLGALPDGLATQLGTEAGGVELSGGQWQRLAIARGMMRRDPLLLVLDEPTSALDPATEHRLFEGYAAAARETGGRGGVTLLVTHRFSTVAAADLVVVLADGRVAEVGTHAELMARGGAYAELYELQARGYRR